jgi:ribosomal protein L40E
MTSDRTLLAIGRGTQAGMPIWTEHFRSLSGWEQDRALTLVKSSQVCLKCGAKLKAKRARCKECRTPNPLITASKGNGVKKSKRIKRQREMAMGFITKGAHIPVTEKAALKASLQRDLYSPDPAIRAAAAGALEQL